MGHSLVRRKVRDSLSKGVPLHDPLIVGRHRRCERRGKGERHIDCGSLTNVLDDDLDEGASYRRVVDIDDHVWASLFRSKTLGFAHLPCCVACGGGKYADLNDAGNGDRAHVDLPRPAR